MKRAIIYAPLLLLVLVFLSLFTNCSDHNTGNKAAKDTTYVIYGAGATKKEVKITGGDTVMEDMEENALIPVKR